MTLPIVNLADLSPQPRHNDEPVILAGQGELRPGVEPVHLHLSLRAGQRVGDRDGE